MRPPYSLPNRLSSPTPYPLSFTTSCFHEFGASYPTQVFHTSKTSPENPKEWAAEKKEESGKEEVFKSFCSKKHQQQEFRGDDISLPNQPIVFQKGGGEEEEN